MSFSIQIQRNESEKNRLTKNVVGLMTVSGVLKAGTSIITPVILVEGDLSSVTDANYMTIAAFSRKYFITDIISVKNNLFEIHGKVDVLSTYADDIKACFGIVAKQETDWNLYIDDGTFKLYNYKLVVQKNFPSGFSNNQYLLTMVGGGSGS